MKFRKKWRFSARFPNAVSARGRSAKREKNLSSINTKNDFKSHKTIGYFAPVAA